MHDGCDVPTFGFDEAPKGVCDLCFGYTARECAQGQGACQNHYEYSSDSSGDEDIPSGP